MCTSSLVRQSIFSIGSHRLYQQPYNFVQHLIAQSVFEANLDQRITHCALVLCIHYSRVVNMSQWNW